jgi:putative DNA primase/helicase
MTSFATLAAAINWHDIGACVLPVKADGTKAPAVMSWTQYQRERMPIDQLEAMLARNPKLGLGIVCGAVSGNLEMLEFEGRAVAEGIYDEFVEICRASGLGEVLDRITCGYTEQSPSGGHHIVYRVTGGPVPGNTKLARRPATEAELVAKPGEKYKVFIETRGEGGFVVVAPSCGPVHSTGQPWQLTAGGPDQMVTITVEERDALFGIARMLDRMPRPEPHHRATPKMTASDDVGLKPGEDYEQRTMNRPRRTPSVQPVQRPPSAPCRSCQQAAHAAHLRPRPSVDPLWCAGGVGPASGGA